MRTMNWCSILLPLVTATAFSAGSAQAAELDPPAMERTWPVVPVDPSGHVNLAAIVVTTEDDVVAFDDVSHKLLKLTSSGTLLDTWAVPESLEVQKLDTGPQGSVYVGCSGRILVFDHDGGILSDRAMRWRDFAVGGAGEIYRIDPDLRDVIVVSTRDGTFLREWDLPLNPWGLPYRPLAIAADPDGVIAFCDTMDGPHCVVSWTFSGVLRDSRTVPLDEWHSLTSGRAGTLYFFENATPSLEAMDGSLIHLAWWSDLFELPWDYYVSPSGDSGGRTYLAETLDDLTGARVLVFAPIGPGAILEADHPGAPYWVDGVQYLGNHRFDWTPGTVHTVTAAPEFETSPGTRESFLSWSDGGDAQHDVTVPSHAFGLRGLFRTERLVSTVVDSGGTATASAWVADSTQVTLSAHEAPGYRFVKWGNPDSVGWKPGDVLTPEWTHTVTHPESWEACFVRQGLVLSISASATDPSANTAAPAMGPRQLYLWAKCLDHGISALEADVTGSLQAGGFIPANGVLNLGEGPNLLCAIPGCPIGAEVNHLLGSWWVADVGGDFCLTRSAANGVLVVVECPSQFPQTFTPTIVGFSSIGDPCVTGPLCGADPDSLPLDPNDVPVVALSSVPSVLMLSSRGNPFRGSIELALDLPTNARAELRIFDVAGRLVRTLLADNVTAGRRAISWDGRDASGAVTPSGIYFARLDAAGERRTLKLVRVSR